MTQAELAHALRTSQGWVSEVESGKATAEIGMVLKALSVLGISINAELPRHSPDTEPTSSEDDGAPPYTL